MSAGAYPNHMEVDNERLTPLDYAIIGGHQEIAQYLIEQHALTISGIKELAASLIQVWVVVYYQPLCLCVCVRVETLPRVQGA